MYAVISKSMSSVPQMLGFVSQRSLGPTDPKIQKVYQQAVRGLAHKGLEVDPRCPSNQVTGVCGNRRGFLTECRCPTLNRALHPEVRIDYEDQVVETTSRLIHEQKLDTFKLAMFCSGSLLGEEIVIFKLFEKLKAMGFQGELQLLFVDTCYEEAIGLGKLSEEMRQLKRELDQTAPEGVVVQATFFGSSSSYIACAQADEQYRHHLLVGADIERANVPMGEMGQKACVPGAPRPIALIKRNSQPELCLVEGNGALTRCRVPGKKRRTESTNYLPYVMVSVAVVALVLFLVHRKRSR